MYQQHLFSKIQELQGVFLAHGKDFLIVKGPASSVQLYGDSVLRGYLDLDILVDAEDFQQVIPLMSEAGYYVKEGQDLVSTKSNVVQKPHHAVFYCENSPYRIEVHTNLFDGLGTAYSASALFDRSVSIPLPEGMVRTLGLVDHAMFIIEHGTHHAWSLLHWLLDAAKILQIEDSSFHAELARQVTRTGQGKKTVFTIELVNSLFPLPIPTPYAPIVAQYHGKFAKHISYSCRQLATAAAGRASFTSILSFTYQFRLGLATKKEEKFRLSTALFLASPKDAEAIPLPSFLSPFHLVFRPFFVIRRRINRLLEQKMKRTVMK